MSIGGYIIVDAFELVGCKRTMGHFFEWHGLNLNQFVDIDKSASFWKKTANPPIKMEKYKDFIVVQP